VRRPSSRAAWSAVVAAITVLAGVAGPARAHTEVLRAVPGPGERVSRAVDTVQLAFLDPVIDDVAIDVADGDGRTVEGLGEPEVAPDGRGAIVSFEPITDPGDYVVEYRFTATDGDTQRETYRFTVVAPPVEGSNDAGVDGAGVAGAAAVMGVLAVAVIVALRRRTSAS
jgi:methionine-rich copper-binding protein CopC